MAWVAAFGALLRATGHQHPRTGLQHALQCYLLQFYTVCSVFWGRAYATAQAPRIGLHKANKKGADWGEGDTHCIVGGGDHPLGSVDG